MTRAMLASKPEADTAPRVRATGGGLKISRPGDALEREADYAADAVLSGRTLQPWSLSRIGITAPLQRKCSCGGGSEGECKECAEKKKLLQRRASDCADVSVAPPIVHEVLSSPGRPLDPGARSFFEPRFGHDFSKVRIHTGAEAAASASAVHAVAFTVGHDIVFDESQYAPFSNRGRELLAHELSHVVQQEGSGSSARPSSLRVGPVNDVFEYDAAHFAHRVMRIAPLARSGPQANTAFRSPFAERSPAPIRRSPGAYVARQCVNPDICGKYKTKKECPEGRPCGYGKSGKCAWPSMATGCCCLGTLKGPPPVPQPSEEKETENKPSTSEKMQRILQDLPAWLAILVAAGLIACVATGVCEVGVIVGAVGAGAAALVIGVMRRNGVEVRGTPEA